MSGSPKILVFGPRDADTAGLIGQLQERYEVVVPPSLDAGLRGIESGDFSGLLLLGSLGVSLGGLLEISAVLEQLPDGLVLLDADLRIIWCNSRLREMTGRDESLTGRSFYEAFGTPEILGPDFCPFNTALAAGDAAKSTLRVGEKSYFEVHAKPVFSEHNESGEGSSGGGSLPSDGPEPTGRAPGALIVIVRDVSSEVLQRQKLNAIYQAGLDLGDLSPHDIMEMSVGDRIELLKAKILSYTKDVLEFETVEIRLLDRRTKRLEPLLQVGMQEDAASRGLRAEPVGNGVTGFVAATGKSYLCEDTQNDPLYLPGAVGARSSLTVPLVLHDEILGTFNVESPRPGAFSENDLQFLELFSRELAVALNTLELLVAEKVTTVNQSTERILREVARPVDGILNDAAWILERYIGHDPNVSDRLRHILQHTRDIKQLIHKVGETIAPDLSYSPLPQRPERPKLRGKRILVVDADDGVRRAAHELLGRYGCEVETAHNGDEAFLMVRSFHYDAVLADIRLPDMTGYDCFSQLRGIHPHLPVILMTGFGYDPTHSIVKARQEGLQSVLYKPFRLDQLLNEVEKAVSSPADLAESSA